MDSILQILVSDTQFVLNVGFICNLMIFCAVLEGFSVMIGHMANLGR